MTNTIQNYWPMQGKSPRPSQVTALDWIESLPSHIRYIILQIPVGGGKSPIALNVSAWMANSLGSGVILTPQKILQKQYEESFDPKYIGSMYGKSNYQCKTKRTNCDIGSSVKPACEFCPHRAAYQKAKTSPNLVLNYKLALLYAMFGVEAIKKRKVVVFDECHTLENHLTEFLAASVSERGCKKLRVPWKQCKDTPEALYFIEERYMPALTDRILELSALVKDIDNRNFGMTEVRVSEKDAEVIKEYKEMKEHFELLESILRTPQAQLDKQYVFVPEPKSFKFKEVYGARVFSELVEPLADRFVFMSSTILDKDGFCSDLGLDPAQAAFIELESEFDVDNRPVHFMPITKMTMGWDGPDKAAERKEMIDTIKMLCSSPDYHKTHSGVIHTASFAVADWLVKELRGRIPQRILHHGEGAGRSRDEVINEFTTANDGVRRLLISPSVTEGLDLKEDLGRFNIIVKTPYPYLGDAWVKRRMELSAAWYTRQAMIAVIQACGRVVRSPTDWGVTYILDSSFEALLRRVWSIVPKWWKAGYNRM